MKQRKYHSLSMRFVILLLISGIISALFFFGVYSAAKAVIDARFSNPEYEQRKTQERVDSLKKYVEINNIAASDKKALSEWVKHEPLAIMEIYRDNILLYSSDMPDSYGASESSSESPYYDWLKYYRIEFADGEADVILSYDFAFRYSAIATIIAILLSALLFISLFLLGCKKTVRYIRQIAGEIQVMEAGDLSSPVTVKGNDDITLLAKSLDAMRLAFIEQKQETERSFANNQQLISEMSHDLRTPLTSLMIYTELLRYRKCDNEEQLNGYIEKINEKALQIKELSENILEYSIINKEQKVELNEPETVQSIFVDAVSELMICLEQYGYQCQFDGHFPEIYIAVHHPFIRRLMDNINSNIIKYAEVSEPVFIRTDYREPNFSLSFDNSVKKNAPSTDSTQIGMTVMKSMMEKMGGRLAVERLSGRFCVTLIFPKSEVQ